VRADGGCGRQRQQQADDSRIANFGLHTVLLGDAAKTSRSGNVLTSGQAMIFC
jgi:hypothetical protein